MTASPTATIGGLRAEGVSVSFGATIALRDVDLAIGPGQALAITGASGSGKSTLCLVLAGLLTPSRGRVLLGGEDSSRRPRADVGYIPQSHALVSGLTAAESVALPLQARRLDPSVIAAAATNSLASVGLTAHADRLVDRLSGGERQRVAIARTIAVEPALIIADEPTAELDPDNRERVLSLFRSLVERGRTVIVATDDDEVLRAFPERLELEEGSVVGRAGG